MVLDQAFNGPQRVFGSNAYFHIAKELQHKLSPKSRRGILMGYYYTIKAYMLWDVNAKKIVESQDVLFDETPVTNPKSNGVGQIIKEIIHQITNLGQISVSSIGFEGHAQGVGVVISTVLN